MVIYYLRVAAIWERCIIILFRWVLLYIKLAWLHYIYSRGQNKVNVHPACIGDTFSLRALLLCILETLFRRNSMWNIQRTVDTVLRQQKTRFPTVVSQPPFFWAARLPPWGSLRSLCTEHRYYGVWRFIINYAWECATVTILSLTLALALGPRPLP